MHIDKLIYTLEELRSQYEDLHVYIWDPDHGWEDFSVTIVKKADEPLGEATCPYEEFVGIH